MDETVHPFLGKVEDWHWWYRTRRDILDDLLSTLPLDAGTPRILDVGCGTGGASLVLSRYGQTVGMDAAQHSFAISMDRPYAHRVVGSAEILPFADESFDVVTALDVIEHLDDDVGSVADIRRVLRPGGAAIFFVPAFNFLWGANDTNAHHRRRYTRASLRKTVEAGGLSVGPIGYFNMLLVPALFLARMAEKVMPSRLHAVEFRETPSLLNSVLEQIFRLELPLLRRSPLPLGSSAFCLAYRR